MFPRRSADRGQFEISWLKSKHSFSFGEYFDQRHMGYGPLRVINEDIIRPGAGFGRHGHKDMEILTYVLKGGVSHQDSLGMGSTIRPGDVQIMSAGTGIEHSEFNASDQDESHLLQIWMIPEVKGLAPRYQQTRFDDAEKRDRLRLIGARDGREGAVTIFQDIDLYASLLTKGKSVTHEPKPGRRLWLQVAQGNVAVNGIVLEQGDGIAIEDEPKIEIIARSDAEVLLFDMRG